MKIAITGGIGAGKSFVCRELERHGIDVYDCDAAAKRLMREDTCLKNALRQLVGQEVYLDDVLQKPILAKFLLESEAHKNAINNVVHPAVARDFEQSGCDWLESAILFESGFIHRTHFDKVICVTAPQEVRLQRVMDRDHISVDKAMAWILAQMEQEEMVLRSDFEIVNDGIANIADQVNDVISKLKIDKK